MEVKNVKLEMKGKNLIGFDFKSENEYLGITKSNQIVTSISEFEINIDFKYPIVRILDEEKFLVINSRTENDKENCFVFNHEGKLINKFYFGDGIGDVKIINNKIVVSYFDEGVLGVKGPNNNGLSVFNLNGILKFGYNEKHGQLIIMDCYCMSILDSQKILFLAYTGFKLIELNLIDFKETSHRIPKNLSGSNAMTTFKDKIYFHSPYHDKDGIYEWKFGEENADKNGIYKGNLKGIQNGKFLDFKNKEYTLIIMN